MEHVFDDWFSTGATNVKDMPDFHADKWSRMFRTSMFDTQPDCKIKKPTQQLTQPTEWDIEDNAIDEEEQLQQQMSRPNQLTEPNLSMMPPTRTCSQVTSKHIKQQSKSPSRELRHSPRTSHQPIMKKSNCIPGQPAETQNQPKSRIG